MKVDINTKMVTLIGTPPGAVLRRPDAERRV